VCEEELCQLRDDHSTYQDAGVQVYVVSCDPAPAQRTWAEQQGWTFPVLSDFWPHGAVAKAYGVFNDDRGYASRATFLVGTDGTVIDAFRSDELTVPREAARYAEALGKVRV
jgi:mycoredoxin-dependent peroxiredoxin